MTASAHSTEEVYPGAHWLATLPTGRVLWNKEEINLFADEKQFPECKTQDDFIQLIAKVLANATHHKKLENEREAFFDQKSNTIVIYNPRARDKGTCFRPRNGLKYYENLK